MASGNTLLTFNPASAELPSSNFATRSKRNTRYVLRFLDTTADQTAYFTDVLPQAYSGNGLTVYVHYAMDTATSGKVRWDIAFERIGDGQQDLDSSGFASAKSINVDPVPATAGHVDIVSAAFTNGAEIDSLAVGESFRLSITRVQSDGTNDTASGYAHLTTIEIRET